MVTVSKPPIPPSRWWVSLAKPRVRDYERGYVALGKELAKAVGRKRPWAHSALVRFVATGSVSAEIAVAISAFFKLPRPAFVARSAKEAFEMEAVSAKYDNEPLSEIEADIIEMEERLEERKRELAAQATAEVAKASRDRHRSRR